MGDVMKPGRGRPALVEAVIALSESDTWDEARGEWEPSGGEHAKGVGSYDNECVCGQKGLVYLFEIANPLTGAVLGPIGSECIHYFEDAAMDASVAALKAIWNLEQVVAAHIPLEMKHLSRLKIAALFEYGAIEQREYNFLLDMFNSRRAPSAKQRAWAVAILRAGPGSVRAFLTDTAAGNRPLVRVRTIPEAVTR
ncbi:hypothetical protein SAMN04488550_2896 [Gordonia malaquae]|uniref:Uncharacterized protein n=1 Tax=Gordonia malaquae NBRC 108250 TaxID=1223542 RepID=M3VAE2_GORML|nr:hypothetical protein [Gordonia malaquae]GAC78768.1 hypothetical protein GM1_004_02130 [Gordonia malaquae NBRC 108250]SED65081.1 hypothetical protein SAMN04488550_2896 [Gordonia malaquae]